jgi:hypothetical protein
MADLVDDGELDYLDALDKLLDAPFKTVSASKDKLYHYYEVTRLHKLIYMKRRNKKQTLLIKWHSSMKQTNSFFIDT